mmetsp:Transcript_2749/g.4825  ORF Transcript_2749/g.4825 Transcript_2749/m.4825 type:complete len:551 (-) Transcript_2749:97-1749(-)
MGSASVVRIGNVLRLRAAQFSQDAGPMAHPIRPESYMEISNFYTATVYVKGAEVIRLAYTLLGADGFRRGTDLYFERHDGQAVTCEDWLKALSDANPDVDLKQLKLWYSQAGTPVVTVTTETGDSEDSVIISLEQTVPPTPGQPEKKPMLIPVAVGAIAPDGSPVTQLYLDDDSSKEETKLLMLREAKQSFKLQGVPKGSKLSVLRGFSAPVILKRLDTSRSDMLFLMAHDTDEFNRWEASQQVITELILDNVKRLQSGESMEEPEESVVSAFEKNLIDDSVDAMLRSMVLSLPSAGVLLEQMDVADPIAVHKARGFLKNQLSQRLQDTLRGVIESMTKELGEEYSLDPVSQGRRALRNCALDLLSASDTSLRGTCLEQVRSATNMTDALSALSTLTMGPDCEEREVALAEFYKKWEHEYLVVDKWLRLQATAPRTDALEIVKRLVSHPAFNISNPNNVYAVLGGFSMGNPFGFHSAEPRGASYEFLADQVLRLDSMNPQVAARIVACFTRWRKFDSETQALMKAQLERIRDSSSSLSPDVYEIVDKSLS